MEPEPPSPAPANSPHDGERPRDPAGSLTRRIDGFPGARILCAGDMMLDVFEYGDVTRVSPEAPVPVLKKTGERRMPGGAGNVAINLRSLECRVVFAGVTGDDAEGVSLKNYLEHRGVSAGLLAALEGAATSVKTRFVAGAHHLLRFDEESPLHMPDTFVRQWLERVIPRIAEADLVLLSDYGKGLFDERTAQGLIRACRRAGKPVIVDPKLPDWTIYRGATLVKPNLKEFEAVSGESFHPGEAGFKEKAQKAGQALCARFHLGSILATLSEHGMIHIPSHPGEPVIHIPTEAREVYDVSGAGDTSLAALGASLAAGAPIREAMKIANAASGIVVGKFGTASVTRDELKEQLEHNFRPASAVLTAGQAAELADRLRAQGRTVGFTNGCFDLLHPGHLESFRRARELCDALIVGLNSDASVRRLKGAGRPINPEAARAAMLTALKAVDYVVIFDDDTALPLVEQIRPDVIAKEGYAPDQWPEGRFVASYGGRAVALPRVEGFSTTSLLERLK